MASTTAPRRKTPVWAKILLVLLVLLLIGTAAFGGLVVGKALGATEERDVQVIRSITREEQVVLLTAGVADLKQESADGLSITIPGLDLIPGLGTWEFDVPGSERQMLIRYDFDAKIGIEGKDVKIERQVDGSYHLAIPEFIYIGSNDPEISVASESNGVLSWITPEIDKFEVAKEVLSEESVAKTIEGARPVLEEQARIFYTNILTAIDPDIDLEFTFAD
ncbi:MAG: hypothetical protein IE924_07810 [Microbacterium sp.]|uniref:hypothetical protein n=1 Tax=Microbacterium sp. TaxID=51671 RepID=UPI0019C8D7EE|nr:hypothetical protein [Microbacterium sp.]MBD3757971.1 hypothetical protein [Microbacterium sp.]